MITRKVKHTPLPLRRSVLEEIEEQFPDAFARVRNAQFRNPTDIAPLTALYCNYAVATGHAVNVSISYAYLDIGEPLAKAKIKAYMAGAGTKVLCLNDTEEFEGGMAWEEKDRLVRDFLQKLFPWRSPWEVLADPHRAGAAQQDVALGRGRQKILEKLS